MAPQRKKLPLKVAEAGRVVLEAPQTRSLLRRTVRTKKSRAIRAVDREKSGTVRTAEMTRTMIKGQPDETAPLDFFLCRSNNNS